MNEPDYSWTQPLCAVCWDASHPGRRPTTVIDSGEETCCSCGRPTTTGIFIRIDPALATHPTRLRDE